MVRRSRVLRSLLALAATSLLTGPLLAADAWPSKPIRLVVPYPPGGSSDIIARTIGPLLTQQLKQPVIIENKPGANGNLGADFVAKAQPDGHTILLCDLGALAISPSLYTKLPFDLGKDLRGTAMLAYSPHLLVVHPSVPANNLQELVALSKKQDLNFAVTATGSAPHLAGVELARATGAKWEYVPYKGGVQSIQDTVAEQGVPGFETGTWQGVVVPAKTPEAVVQRLHEALVTAIRKPEVRARLTGQGAEVVTMNPAETARFISTERQRWQKVVQEAGIKLD